jgi:hypothetical protein
VVTVLTKRKKDLLNNRLPWRPKFRALFVGLTGHVIGARRNPVQFRVWELKSPVNLLIKRAFFSAGGDGWN